MVGLSASSFVKLDQSHAMHSFTRSMHYDKSFNRNLCYTNRLLIVLGNEARHIGLEDATQANYDASVAAEPNSPVYNYSSINIEDTEVFYVECDGPAEKIPDGETE